MYKTMYIMGYFPYQLVSRISSINSIITRPPSIANQPTNANKTKATSIHTSQFLVQNFLPRTRCGDGVINGRGRKILPKHTPLKTNMTLENPHVY